MAGLLPLLLLLFLLLADHRHHRTQPVVPQAQPVVVHHQPNLLGVGMPSTIPGNIPVKPISIVLVMNRTYRASAEHHELRTLAVWLEDHTNPKTRITLINATSHTSTSPLAVGELGTARPRTPFPGLPEAVRRSFRAGRGDRLLITLGTKTTLDLKQLTTLHIRPRQAGPPASALTLAPGKAASVTIDTRYRGTFAATAARAVIVVSQLQADRT